MSLTQELDDACEEIGSKIILTSNVLEEESLPNLSSTSSSNAFSSPQTFLRVGKPGKLFLKPNYTAFTKTNLGSIPSKVEKTLIKTEESIPITITLNKHVQKINLPQEKEDSNISRSFSTSYSSKGYGVGFVSKVPRFDYGKKAVYPGPGDYSPEKMESLENNINKSNFGKSLFLEKSGKSLQLLQTNQDKFYTSQEILNILRKSYDQRYNNNTDNIINKNNNSKSDENNKGNYYFESKVKKFSNGIFNVNNKNPGPGKYFIDTNFRIKNKDRKSPDFFEPIEKREDPLKTFGILSDNEKKIGFNLIGSNKGGKPVDDPAVLRVARHVSRRHAGHRREGRQRGRLAAVLLEGAVLLLRGEQVVESARDRLVDAIGLRRRGAERKRRGRAGKGD